MSNFFNKITKKRKIDTMGELSRAHIIIALLCLSVIVLLSMGVANPITYDPTLSAICVVLLSIVAFISLSITFTLKKLKK